MPALLAFTGSSRRAADWSESELLARLLDRDERAWVELVRRYRRLVYSCILKATDRLGADAHALIDVDDIYAEVMVGLLRDDMRKLRMYDPSRGTKLSSWIGLITINATYDHVRSSVRRPVPEHLDGVLDDSAEDEAQSPLDILIEKERWTHLNGVLSSFSDKDRTFMDLYYARGLEASVVAEEMDITLKTVYSKKHKIREHLRRQIRNEGHSSAICDLAA